MQRAGIVYREEELMQISSLIHVNSLVFFSIIIIICLGNSASFGAEWEEEGEHGGVVRISSLKVNSALIVM